MNDTEDPCIQLRQRCDQQEAEIRLLKGQLTELRRSTLQRRVDRWMARCFGDEISRDRAERNYRFLEESLELVQACGCSETRARELVAYVFARPTGEAFLEAGGVMITLAALASAHDFSIDDAAEKELRRVWTLVAKIREKHRNKPIRSGLPRGDNPAG